MSELVIDFITSLDGYASAEGWPGWWGLEGPEYLTWLGERPERHYTILMGANTYRLMYGFASESGTFDSDMSTDEDAATAELTRLTKVVFSSTLQPPLSWANTRLVREDPVEAVSTMKREGNNMSTLGSLTLCRSLLEACHDRVRFRAVADHVAEMPDGIDVASMGEDRVERHDVAMDIG